MYNTLNILIKNMLKKLLLITLMGALVFSQHSGVSRYVIQALGGSNEIPCAELLNDVEF
jgi:hypothetical protein